MVDDDDVDRCLSVMVNCGGSGCYEYDGCYDVERHEHRDEEEQDEVEEEQLSQVAHTFCESFYTGFFGFNGREARSKKTDNCQVILQTSTPRKASEPQGQKK